jgi:hypothetical protein
MSRNAYVFCLVVVTLGGLGGCGGPATKESKPAGPDKIQGKALVVPESTPTDSALNAGGPSLHIWDGLRRYRLFVRKPLEITNEKQYVVEGVHAQRAIDEIGDPDQGKNGYPLLSSCERVIRMAWSGLGFYEADEHASVLRRVVNRYPARPIFLVGRITPATSKEGGAGSAEAMKGAGAEEKDVPEISVPADKQRAFLLEAPPAQTAPLWEPAGGTVLCKVIIDTEGKVSELQTGAQLCEIVPWPKFRYKPQVQRGRPVRVKTEIEVRFEPRK